MVEKRTQRILVKIDKSYFRHLEVNHLIGDSTLIRDELGWQPIISFEQLVEEMVTFDLLQAKN